MTGETFSRLKVLKRAENNKRGGTRWLCLCDCNNETIVSGSNLISGMTKSCGCLNKEKTGSLNFKDLTGLRFSRLTVIKRVENNKLNNPQYLCKCECGNETIVVAGSLRSKHTKSCGCLNKESSRSRLKEIKMNLKSRNYGNASRNRVLYDYKRKARKKAIKLGVPFEEYWGLTDDETYELMLQPCELCGIEPSNKQVNHFENGDFIYSGIDRIDNNKGYVKDNVRSCCGTCNWAKNDGTDEEFKAKVNAIYEHLNLQDK